MKDVDYRTARKTWKQRLLATRNPEVVRLVEEHEPRAYIRHLEPDTVVCASCTNSETGRPEPWPCLQYRTLEEPDPVAYPVKDSQPPTNV